MKSHLVASNLLNDVEIVNQSYQMAKMYIKIIPLWWFVLLFCFFFFNNFFSHIMFYKNTTLYYSGIVRFQKQTNQASGETFIKENLMNV